MGDKHGAEGALYSLAHVANDSGDYERAETLYDESLVLIREVGDHRAVGGCLCSLRWVVWRRGERDLAARLLEQELACYREAEVMPDPENFLDLAHITLGRGDPVRAKTLLEEGLPLARRHGMKLDAAITLDGMAMIAGVRGEVERVARLWGWAAD